MVKNFDEFINERNIIKRDINSAEDSPECLLKISDYLNSYKLNVSKEHVDGRVGSIKDEDSCIKALYDADEFITVKEICQKAGVNRSTFYLHYENTTDLLEETISYINNKINNTFKEKILDINNIDKEELFFITPKYLKPYLELVKENKRVFKLIHDKPHLFKNKEMADRLYHDLFSIVLTKYNVPENIKKYVFSYDEIGLENANNWLIENVHKGTTISLIQDYITDTRQFAKYKENKSGAEPQTESAEEVVAEPEAEATEEAEKEQI